VKVDRKVEVSSLELEAEAEIFPESARRVRLRCDDDVVKMWIALNDRSGKRFDEVGEPRGWVRFPDRLDRRRCQNDIADQTEANDENSVELVSW
jgi:hypothetical protein